MKLAVFLCQRMTCKKLCGVPCNDGQPRHPEQIRQRVKIPDIELVMQRSTETHPDKIRRKQNENHVCNIEINSTVK